MTESSGDSSFYWQTSRDSLLTPAALTMFQIAAKHDGEDFDKAKYAIDEQYEIARGRPPSRRHGGNFQTFVRVFEEAGWVQVDTSEEQRTLRITPAGQQALVLFKKAPDFLKAAPYFMLELLSRYQLNNPSGPENIRNPEIEEATSQSNLFPYWTIWKIMRSCDNEITTEELRRFVFRLQRSEDIEDTIKQIRAFRRDQRQGISEEELAEKYPPEIEGAVGEPKYIMGRAGTHIGNHPSLVEKPDRSTYVLNPVYYSMIDAVLKNEPVYKEYIDSETWFRDYGQPVLVSEEFWSYSVTDEGELGPLEYSEVEENDPIWLEIRDLVEMGSRNFLFVGPPGTSKTTYALSIGAKLVNDDRRRFHNIQFHQSFAYEDFVIGFVPSEGSDGTSFTLKRKVFLQACDTAMLDHPNRLHVLVVDEINRGDPSRVFGEALTYIERRDEQFELAYGGQMGYVPSNLVILATLNPYDKSIADIDQALDRRFEKITMRPSVDILRHILIECNGMERSLAGRVSSFFTFLISEVPNRFGQAYFKNARDTATLRRVWQHQLLPVLRKELRYDEERLERISERFASIFESPASET